MRAVRFRFSKWLVILVGRLSEVDQYLNSPKDYRPKQELLSYTPFQMNPEEDK